MSTPQYEREIPAPPLKVDLVASDFAAIDLVQRYAATAVAAGNAVGQRETWSAVVNGDAVVSVPRRPDVAQDRAVLSALPRY